MPKRCSIHVINGSPDSMTSEDEPKAENAPFLGPEQLLKILNSLEKQTHAGKVLSLASWLDNQMEALLVSRMPGLSKKSHKTLFEGMAPLSSFSSRIYLARALDFISEEQAAELHKIRNIRNQFAHNNEPLDFENQRIKDMVSNLARAKRKDYDTPLDCFLKAVTDVSLSVQKIINADDKTTGGFMSAR